MSAFSQDMRAIITQSSLFHFELMSQQIISVKPGLVDMSCEALVDLYLSDRSLWRLSPHPLFDGDFYLRQSPDIVVGDVNPLYHYITWGSVEGRDPSILFDERYYRANHLPKGCEITSLEHFVTVGAELGALPYPHFDYDLYRSIVAEALDNAAAVSDFAMNFSGKLQRQFAESLVTNMLSKSPRAQVSISDCALPMQDQLSSEITCDVVIPVKNAIQWLARALHALFESSCAAQIGTVIIVDDGSTPESVEQLEYLQQLDTRIVVKRSDRESGFAAACNFGAEVSSAPLILFLNSDCLVSKMTVQRLIDAFTDNPATGLACPLANNAANVSLSLLPGASSEHMEGLLGELSVVAEKTYPEICTVVGHCLMVSRKCYGSLGGMDQSWGLGYGEESDFHLRARAKGFLGVAVPDAYAYHFGGGTFRHVDNRLALQRTNHARFMALWGDSFGAFFRTVALQDPVRNLEKILSQKSRHLPDSCDVLFVLPGLSRGVGGIQVVIDLCNFLISHHMDARIVILGQFDRTLLVDYSEPLLMNPLHAPDEKALLEDLGVTPRIVVTTLFATVPASYKLAWQCKATLINFIQGYEFYFDNGVHYERVRESYYLADFSIATSAWLADRARAKAPGSQIIQLPLGIDPNVFYPLKTRRDIKTVEKVRVGMVIRPAPDKGQFVLRELIDLLFELKDRVELTLFLPEGYDFTSPWIDRQGIELVRLPIDRNTISEKLRQTDIFVDASLHEGYGLFPLEAMTCGACVIASDSGGIRQFLEDGYSGLVIKEVNQPERYFHAIEGLIRDRQRLERLQQVALLVSRDYAESACFERYQSFFEDIMVTAPVAMSSSEQTHACD